MTVKRVGRAARSCLTGLIQIASNTTRADPKSNQPSARVSAGVPSPCMLNDEAEEFIIGDTSECSEDSAEVAEQLEARRLGGKRLSDESGVVPNSVFDWRSLLSRFHRFRTASSDLPTSLCATTRHFWPNSTTASRIALSSSALLRRDHC